MIQILLLLVSIAGAQDTPYYNRQAKTDQDLGGLNQNFRDLSDRIPGGTNSLDQTVAVDAPYSLDCSSNSVAINGAVIVNGIIRSAVCGTVSSAVTGFASLTATQTFSGDNTFLSQSTFSATVIVSTDLIVAKNLMYGEKKTINPNGIAQEGYWAKNISGATLSSGCVGKLFFTDETPTAQMVFSTYATAGTGHAANGQYPAILVDPLSCPTNQICRFGTWGFYRATMGAGFSNQYLDYSSTVCQLTGTNSQAVSIGSAVNTGSCATSGSTCWIHLGPQP